MFEVIDISVNADDLEQLGTKEKFWFLNKNQGRKGKYLFKYSRENTGEHWSEKIAEQLCNCLGIPHATYELATCSGRKGVITPNLIEDHCRMVMGNEVLHVANPTQYPRPEIDNERRTRVKEHTVSRVLACLDNGKINIPTSEFNLDGLNSGDLFCGYLLLDALVSNQDRHHENWAIIINHNDKSFSLSPTYDHAACLGRELTDENRRERLITEDKNRQIPTFVKKARSQLFASNGDRKTLTTIDAFYLSVAKREQAKRHWISKVDELNNDTLKDIIDNVPDDIMSHPSKEFALAMLIENRKRVLNDEQR